MNLAQASPNNETANSRIAHGPLREATAGGDDLQQHAQAGGRHVPNNVRVRLQFLRLQTMREIAPARYPPVPLPLRRILTFA
jgi:hypothetical protein